MPNTKQAELWKTIQRDAKRAGLSDGAFLAQNPQRLEDYQGAARKLNPLNDANAAHRVIMERAQQHAQSRHISKDAALVEILKGEPDTYQHWRQQRDQRLGLPDGKDAAAMAKGDGGATGPLSADEMLELQRLCRRYDVDLSLEELSRAGFVAAHQLLADLRAEHADMTGDSGRAASEDARRFSETDEFPEKGREVTWEDCVN